MKTTTAYRSTQKTWLRGTLLASATVAVLILALSVFPSVVNGAAPTQPALPHTFSGSVTMDGSPAPQGTVVTIFVDGVAIASVLVDASGGYAGLQVPMPGVTATFTVGGLPAAETGSTEAGGTSIIDLTATSAAQGPDVPPTATPVPVPTNTPVQPTPVSIQSAFRVGPTVRLRPVNDVIDQNQDGIVEVLFRNPVNNDVTMVVDLSVSLPSGFHVYGEGFATSSAAGTASGSYRVPPGQSITVYVNIKSEKIGRFPVQFSGTYWPEGNKDLYSPLSFSHPFTVNAASVNPRSAAPTDPGQITAVAAQSPSNAGQPAGPASGDPSASCSLSPHNPGSKGAGDMALLGLPLLGLAGLRWRGWRRRDP